jgi:hypothetical protein
MSSRVAPATESASASARAAPAPADGRRGSGGGAPQLRVDVGGGGSDRGAPDLEAGRGDVDMGDGVGGEGATAAAAAARPGPVLLSVAAHTGMAVRDEREPVLPPPPVKEVPYVPFAVAAGVVRARVWGVGGVHVCQCASFRISRVCDLWRLIE